MDQEYTPKTTQSLPRSIILTKQWYSKYEAENWKHELLICVLKEFAAFRAY